MSKKLYSQQELILASNFILQCSKLDSTCLFSLITSSANISLSILPSIPHSKPLHCGLNQHHEWKYRPLGQRKGIISASSMQVILAECAFSLEAKRQKSTFPNFFQTLECTHRYRLICPQNSSLCQIAA